MQSASESFWIQVHFDERVVLAFMLPLIQTVEQNITGSKSFRAQQCARPNPGQL